MKILRTSERGFTSRFERLCRRLTDVDGAHERAVRSILAAVERRGDAALAELTRRHDGVAIDPRNPWLPKPALRLARTLVGRQAVADLELARDRLHAFQARGLERSWSMSAGPGVRLEQRVHPLARVGVYVPGGKGAYPSTVLMNCVPARAAGVGEILLATPPSVRGEPRLGGIDPHVLVAAELAGVDRILTAGGAQAIAALAFGTRAVPRVDKIVGPGNRWVATAKRLVYGRVDIDSVAGPSEVLVIADGSVPAAWTAADLLSQAEHDEDAICLLVATRAAAAEAVRREIERQVDRLPTARIARASLAANGTIVVAKHLKEAIALAEQFAPEHLELHVADAGDVARGIVNAGAVFVGPHTPEALGDYLAGPNHVLPTGGTARCFSPLSAHAFLRRSNVLTCSRAGLARLGPPTARIAEIEGFAAHARSVTVRTQAVAARTQTAAARTPARAPRGGGRRRS